LSTELAASFEKWLSCWPRVIGSWLTTLMKEICGCRAFHTARTAKHFRKFVRTSHTGQEKQYNSFPVKNIKILIPTPPYFSARVYFRCFNLQQLVLKICSNYFKFAATLFYLQQPFLVCSNYFICSNFLICSMSLVGHRRNERTGR